MLELFKIGARLALDKGDFDRGVKDADESGKGLAESLEKSIDKVKNFLKNSAIVALAVKGAQAVWNLAKSTSEAGDRIDKQSQALGFSRKAYQEWAYILRQSGASIDDMGMAMKTMQEVIAGNSAEAAAGLSKLGLSAAHLQSLSPEDQFETLVKAFQQMPEGAEKSRLAMQLFGRNAQSLMPLLNSSADDLDGLRQRAHDLGLIMSDEDVDASVAFGDALDDLNAVWGALKQKFGAQLLPGFTKGLVAAANALGRITNAVSDAFKTGDWKTVFKTLTEEISNFIPGIIDTAVNIATGLFENADKIIDLAMSIVNGLADGLAKALPKLVARLPQIARSLLNGFKNLGKTIGNSVIDIINGVFGTNIPHIDEIRWPTWPEVQKAATDAWNKIKEEAQKLAGLVFGTKADGSVDWPDWPTVQKKANEAWEDIKKKALTLAGLVFGTKADGSVNWPTWNDVVIAARFAWTKIKNKALQIADEAGALVFGRRQDGSVNWPDWSTVSTKAVEIWEGIKKGALGIARHFGAIVFGTTKDGKVAWPTWDDVVIAARLAWTKIKDKALGIANLIGGVVFGRKKDGSVNWPDWETVKTKAKEIWNNIKTKALNAGKEFGALVFGRNKDGSVAWPTWSDVKKFATKRWEEIKTEAAKLKGLVFGDAADAGQIFETIKNKWTELRTAIEEKIIDVATYFFGDSNPTDVAAAIKTIGDVLVALGAGILTATLVTHIQGIIGSIQTLFSLPSANPVALTLAGIATAFMLIAQNWDKIEPILKDVGDYIDQNIIQPLNTFFSDLRTWISNAVNDIKRFLGLRVAGELTKGEAEQLKYAYQSSNGSKEDLYESGFVSALRTNLEKAGFEAEDIETIVEQIVNSDDPSWVTNFIDDLTTAEGKARALAEILNGRGGYTGFSTYGEWANDYYSKHPHASGLNYVPYDGYNATLHRGEAILNANQGREWRQNGGSGLDMRQLYESVASAVAAAVSGIAINMDGKAVGNAVTEQVSRNLYLNQLGRRFATP